MELKSLSYSSLSLYNQCPRRWKYFYVEKFLEEKENSLPMIAGYAFHEIAKDFYQNNIFNRKWLISNWARYFEIQLETHINKFGKVKEIEYFKSTGYPMLNNFYNYISTNDLMISPYKIEWKVKVDYKDLKINSRLDLILEVKDEFWIIDYKTTKKKWQLDDISNDKQFTIYSYVFRKHTNLIEDKLGKFFVKQKKMLFTTRNESNYQGMFIEFDKMIAGVTNDEFPLNCNEVSCKYCTYPERCKNDKNTVQKVK